MDSHFYHNILTIDQTTLHNAIQGGLLISLASSIYYFLFGGILGMSGIAGSLVKQPTSTTTKNKILILTGVIASSAIMNTLYQRQSIQTVPFDSPEQTQAMSITHIIVAGALVGVGTQIANGCTSGHGLCGMPRLSLNSFVAVACFLCTAAYTTTYSLKNHIPEVPELHLPALDRIQIKPIVYLIASIFVTLLLFILKKRQPFIANFALFCIGVVFGCGLMISGMTQRHKVKGFLQLDSSWDPTLIIVLGTAVSLNLITFTIIRKYIRKPSYGESIQDPHKSLNLKVIFGSVLFGLGWGIGGICPGPYILTIPNSFKIAIYWGLPFFLGQKISQMANKFSFGYFLRSEKVKHH